MFYLLEAIGLRGLSGNQGIGHDDDSSWEPHNLSPPRCQDLSRQDKAVKDAGKQDSWWKDLGGQQKPVATALSPAWDSQDSHRCLRQKFPRRLLYLPTATGIRAQSCQLQMLNCTAILMSSANCKCCLFSWNSVSKITLQNLELPGADAGLHGVSDRQF